MAEVLISQLAERTGVPATTLRFYEGAGLLPAARTPGGYRVYGEDALSRLRFIAVAKRLGLPLAEIADVLRLWADGSCGQVGDDLRPRLAARIAEAEQRASELAAFTATLRRAREALDDLPDRDGRCGPHCAALSSAGLPAEGLPPGGLPASVAPGTPAGPGSITGETEPGPPVACSLEGTAVRDRVRRWRDLAAGAGREPVAGGLRLTLPPGRAAEAAALAAAELECCPFFDFRLHLAGQWLTLEVRAPEAAVGLLAELIAKG
jgi:MerR family copper efflux transcriptional regulator